MTHCAVVIKGLDLLTADPQCLFGVSVLELFHVLFR